MKEKYESAKWETIFIFICSAALALMPAAGILF